MNLNKIEILLKEDNPIPHLGDIKQYKVACHPDKFPSDEKEKAAGCIFI